MNIMRGSLLLALTFVVFACGRNETMASKSAAAYREAQAKGVPVSGGREHGGHEVAPATTAAAEMDHFAHGTAADAHADHGAHGTMSATDHAAMDHAAMDHATHGSTAAADPAAMGHDAHTAGTMTDHAQHAAPSHSAAGHQAHDAAAGAATHDHHAAMQHDMPASSADAHAQHQQPAGATAHAGHGAMQQPAAGAPRVVLGAPTTNAEIARTQPAATLRQDDFDAPSPVAVEEAQRAAAPPPKKEQ